MLIKEERSIMSKRQSEPSGANNMLDRKATGELLSYAAGMYMIDQGPT